MPGLNSAAMTLGANAIKGALQYAQLHFGPAGLNGANHQSIAPRKTCTWSSVTGLGDFELASPINFTGGEINGPVHSVSLWSADREGTAGSTGVGSAITATTTSWSDSIPGTASYAVVWISGFPGSPTPGTTVTIGGVSCTEADGSPFVYETDGYGYRYGLQCFVLKDPPTGTKTVAINRAAGGTGINAVSVYYQGVDSHESLSLDYGLAGTHPSMTVANSSVAKIYTSAFAMRVAANPQGFTTYSQYQRYNVDSFYYGSPLQVGDASGTGGDVVFSANRNNTTYNWGGAILPLVASGGTFYGEFPIGGANTFNGSGDYTLDSLKLDGSSS